MKVILTRPPDPLGMVDVLSHVLPTNLGYLASYLLKHGIEVEIWDYELESFTVQDFLKRVKETSPDLIGFSCMTPTVINGGVMAALVKEHFPDIVTVVGGAHSSAFAEGTLKEFPAFDIVVMQEGEITLYQICQRVANGQSMAGLEGVAHRIDGQVVKESPREFADIHEFPWPARQLYHKPRRQHGHSSRGFSNQLVSTEIFTSRGCPYACTFCAIVATFGRTVRWRNLDDVFAEVKDCRERYGIEHFVIADDTFGLKPGRAEALSEGFAKLKLKSWNCDTRVDAVDAKILKAMADSGCRKVAFGIETGSPRVVALNKKKITLERVEQAVAWSWEAGIKHVEGNFIVGSHPDETFEDIELTAKLLRKLKLSFVSISVIVPYPGTEDFAVMEGRNHVYSRDWSKYVMFGQDPGWRTLHFSPKDLLRLQKRLNAAFYLNPSYMTHMLMTIRSLDELRYYSKAGLAFMKWLMGLNIVPANQAGDLRALVPHYTETHHRVLESYEEARVVNENARVAKPLASPVLVQ